MTSQHWLAVNPDTGEIITDNETKRVVVTHAEMFEALAKCCDMLPALKTDGKRDWASMTRTERGMLNRVSKELREAGRSVDDVRGFREWFRLNDWRGKRGDPPLPTDVVKMFTRYMTARMPLCESRFKSDWERYKLAHPEAIEDETEADKPSGA